MDCVEQWWVNKGQEAIRDLSLAAISEDIWIVLGLLESEFFPTLKTSRYFSYTIYLPLKTKMLYFRGLFHTPLNALRKRKQFNHHCFELVNIIWVVPCCKMLSTKTVIMLNLQFIFVSQSYQPIWLLNYECFYVYDILKQSRSFKTLVIVC